MLADLQIRKIKPTANRKSSVTTAKDGESAASESGTRAVGGGLFLLVTPQCGKFWRLAY